MPTPKDERRTGGSDNADHLTEAHAHGEEHATRPVVYDPGPSFIDHDEPAVCLPELPAWLQEFASSMCFGDEREKIADSSESDDQEPSAINDDAKVVEASDEPALELPTWLSAPRDRSTPVNRRDAHGKSKDPGTPRSDMELPDWLQSPGQAASVTSGDQEASRRIDGDGLALFGVPLVAQAWVTVPHRVQLTDGGSVFALVASRSQVERNKPPAAVEYRTAGKADQQSPDASHEIQSAGLSIRAIDPGNGNHSDRGSVSRRKVYIYAALAISVLVLVVLLILVAF